MHRGKACRIRKKLHPLVSLWLFHHCALSIKFYKKKKKKKEVTVGETRMRTKQMTNSNERWYKQHGISKQNNCMVQTSKTDHFFKLAPFWSPLKDLIDFGMAGKLLTLATRWCSPFVDSMSRIWIRPCKFFSVFLVRVRHETLCGRAEKTNKAPEINTASFYLILCSSSLQHGRWRHWKEGVLVRNFSGRKKKVCPSVGRLPHLYEKHPVNVELGAVDGPLGGQVKPLHTSQVSSFPAR